MTRAVDDLAEAPSPAAGGGVALWTPAGVLVFVFALETSPVVGSPGRVVACLPSGESALVSWTALAPWTPASAPEPDPGSSPEVGCPNDAAALALWTIADVSDSVVDTSSEEGTLGTPGPVPTPRPVADADASSEFAEALSPSCWTSEKCFC